MVSPCALRGLLVQGCNYSVRRLDDAHVSIAANDIKALDRGHACVICLERPPVVALLPCGHKTLCDDEVRAKSSRLIFHVSLTK